MARTAGWVDQVDFFERVDAERRRQRAVQDEGLDELRRLQQGIAFPRCFRQVLVQVAQESRVPVGVCEVVDQCPGVGIGGAEEAHQLLAHVGRDRSCQQDALDFHHVRQARQAACHREHVAQVVVVRCGRVLQIEGFLTRHSGLASGIRARDQRRVEQVVVFAEADEHASQHPRHGGLGELRLSPSFQGLGCPSSVACCLPIGREAALVLSMGSKATAQIALQVSNLDLQVGQQFGAIDHGCFDFVLVAAVGLPCVRWAFSSQARGMRP